MSPFATLALVGDVAERRATPAGARWFTSLQLRRGACELTTGDEETCVLLLAGTFDLVGGTTAWPNRGARQTPYVGRPVAVFLPPATAFAARNGSGELLLIAARQPSSPTPRGREALHQSPLLPLAGSGKAFDPTAGEWRPAETFPTAPESLPPRRIERVQQGAVAVERVFAPDYKAATLCVDEFVVPAGHQHETATLPLPEPIREHLVYVRSSAPFAIEHAGARHECAAETARFGSGVCRITVHAGSAPVYGVVAHAGKTTA